MRRIYEAAMAAGWSREQASGFIDAHQANGERLEELLTEMRDMNR